VLRNRQRPALQGGEVFGTLIEMTSEFVFAGNAVNLSKPSANSNSI
jgi:hypothetical protein